MSNLQLPPISLGCMSLSTDHVLNSRLLHRAIEAGIRLFDTADLYQQGQNEITVGKALLGKRQQVTIATKVGNQWRPDGSGWDWNPGKQYILSAVEDSLRRLQTDYIDLYQLHGGTINDPIDEIIEAFELLVQQGKIRQYGISSIRPNVIREYVRRSRIATVMMQYSLLDRRPEETCLPLLQQHGIGVLARGGLAKGLLVNKPAAPYLDYTATQVQQAAAAIQSLSGPHRTAAQTALQFVIQHPAITTAVVGVSHAQQLEDVIGALHAPALTEEETEMLKGVIPVSVYGEHR